MTPRARAVGPEPGRLSFSGRVTFDERGRVVQQDEALFDPTTGAPLPDGPLTPGDGFVSRRFAWDAGDAITSVTDDDGSVTSILTHGTGASARVTTSLGATFESGF